MKYAFESGQKAVASMPARLTPQTSGRKEEAKFQLMGAGDLTHGHDVPIFIDLPDGTVNDTSPTLCPSTCRCCRSTSWGARRSFTRR